MNRLTHANRYLETRWVTPGFGGALLMGLSFFLFAAAVNSMAGWLYVITGVMLALLMVAAITPPRVLKGLAISRLTPAPVHAGDRLSLSIIIENPSGEGRQLLQVQDHVPKTLGTFLEQPPLGAIAELPCHGQYRCDYTFTPEERGVFSWQRVSLRTAAPLGLFWCRRFWQIPMTVVVYPRILTLKTCPLLDQLGQDQTQEWRDRQMHRQLSSDGLTRSLRPYRWGDPLRLVHWRTSARYGELRVRELDTFRGGAAITIALDNSVGWAADHFEQAVIATASLVVFSTEQQVPVQFWSHRTGMIQGQSRILRTLAEIHPEPESHPCPQEPMLWLTAAPKSLKVLPSGSVGLVWGASSLPLGMAGKCIDGDRPLILQLQS
ncbi:DUF58 domain-containing protein [Candidatus Synechococcus calcipolaris G9]|uniref:DUF58 domain-containing protein n=1 Tax=Candidatus Synechococcus calcipolaris G9 TaxID=1497997 RepID=A0ABT6EYG8_9SYNE|nr:DUF58 domain-containing protein [Candidatus Synechococcus calcipolaris]MDG2990836.1 DUF58 domain-containing protein [Candidatus Synechococcus calcipolaris G9]